MRRWCMNRKKRIIRTLWTLGVVILIVLLGGYLIFQTQAFNRFVAQEIVQKTAEITGAQLRFDRMLIHWGQLKVDFYNLALSAPANSRPPLLSCDHLGVRLRILSLWKRKIDLQEILFDKPVLSILVDANGRNNLPNSPTPSPGTPQDKIFDLAVRSFELNSGQIIYHDRQIPLSAELRDLRTKLRFEVTTQSYEGMLAYDRGRIAAKNLTPFEHRGKINLV